MYKKLQITFRNTDDETTKNVVWDIRDIPLAQKNGQRITKDYQILMQELKNNLCCMVGYIQN